MLQKYLQLTKIRPTSFQDVLLFEVANYILNVGKAPNNLLDVGKDMDKLTGREIVFYDDQLSTRECRLSENMKEEYELEVQTKRIAAAEAQTREDNKEWNRWVVIQWWRCHIVSASRIK